MNEQNKKAFDSVMNQPSDPYQSFKICTEKVLKEMIDNLEKREARNEEEEKTLNMATEIYNQRFGKETTK